MAPTAKDGEITAELLRGAGIDTRARARRCAALVEALNEGAAAVLVAEEHLAGAPRRRWPTWLAKQPPWSDLPILILTRPGADSPESAEAWRTLGNVTLLERPTRVTTLLSAAQTAIRARSRQYQIRGHLAERLKNEQALRSADRRKDEFLATLGHELRNPLAPILNSLEILKLSGAFDERARRSRPCAVMERQVHHLNRLVDDLLEVSRITRGIIEVQQGAARSRRHRQGRDRDQPPGARQPAPRADRRARSGEPIVRRRRPGAADAGVRQPAEQRREVHQPRRPHHRSARRRERRRGGGQRQGRRHRHRAGRCWRRCSTCSCRSIARRGDRRAGSASA